MATLSAFLVGHAEEVEARRVDAARILAQTQIANGGERDDGVNPGARIRELPVVEDELPAHPVAVELPAKGGELIRRKQKAGADFAKARPTHCRSRREEALTFPCRLRRVTPAVTRSRGEGLDLRAHFARGLEAQFGLRLQRAQHDFIEAHIDLHLARGRLEFGGGQLAGEHFVEDNTERINVRAMIGALMLALLGRHVLRRAGGGVERAFAGERRTPVRRVSAACLIRADLEIGAPFRRAGGRRSKHLRDAEVRDFHAAIFIEQQILRLDVAMHDAVFMRVLQGLAHGRHDGERLLGCETPGLHRLPQIHAVHKLHQQEVKGGRGRCRSRGAEGCGLRVARVRGRRGGDAEVVNGDDVRMIQRGERLRFARETLGEFRIGHALGREEFQRDEPVERLLPRLVNDAHSPAPEEFENLQLRKQRREFLRRERFLRRGFSVVGLARDHRLGHEAARTQARRGGGRQRDAAVGAVLRGGR